MPQKYKFSYTYANITAKMCILAQKMHMNMVIYRLSNVYLSCIYRICNVVDSEMEAEEQVSFH